MKKKILVACLCVALAVLTVAGTTLAYLTSKDEVTNTFTVGNVKMTMDEAAVNTDGEKLYKEDGTTLADRVRANEYILSPGHTYVKDPIVHMDDKSENCYVFIKVENGLGVLEAATSAEEGGYKNIAAQITANGWKQLTDADGKAVADVYYMEYTKGQEAKNLKVFENFKIADNANTLKNANNQVIWDTITDANKITVNVTAYAIQKDGFTTAAAAWAEVGK